MININSNLKLGEGLDGFICDQAVHLLCRMEGVPEHVRVWVAALSVRGGGRLPRDRNSSPTLNNAIGGSRSTTTR